MLLFFYLILGINPNIDYPIWYLIMRMIWMIVGLTWLSTVIGAKSDCIKTFLETTNSPNKDNVMVSFESK